MASLDSSFLIDIMRKDQSAYDLLEELESSNQEIFISSVSVMELMNGAFLSNDPKKEREKVIGLVNSFNELKFDNEMAFLAGEINAQLTKKGEMIQIEDVMIASCAINNDQVLVTRNKKDFEKIKSLKIKSY